MTVVLTVHILQRMIVNAVKKKTLLKRGIKEITTANVANNQNK